MNKSCAAGTRVSLAVEARRRRRAVGGRGVVAGLLVSLLALVGVGPALGFDLSAPIKTVRRVLGQKEPAAPAHGGAVQRAERSAAGVDARTAGAAPAAVPDSADVALLEDVLLSPPPYSYESIGRRDPFVSLVNEDDSGRSRDDDGSGKLTVRGILWGDNDRFALVETGEGDSFILRQGDRCGRFNVTRVEPDGIVVYWSEYGVGKSQRLPLTQGKRSKDDRRTR